MITDTQILEAARAVLPLDPFAIVRFISSAPIPLPLIRLQRERTRP